MNIATDTERKTHTGFEKRIDGFRVLHTFVHRRSSGLYDVYVQLKPTGDSDFALFGDAPKTHQARIFSGVENRKEAVRIAQFARDRLLSMIGKQIQDWQDAVI